MRVTASAQGKLILSGEHSVLYGQMALVCPLPMRAQAVIQPCDTWDLHLADFQQSKRFSHSNLIAHLGHTRKNYAHFLTQQAPIQQVCPQPMDLWQGLVARLLERFALKTPCQLTLSSQIPQGAGLGSSAALIMAALKALNHFYQLNQTDAQLLSLALEVENWQHGQSSGLDLHASISKTCLAYHRGHTPQSLDALCLNKAFQLVFTGKPQSTTGACVAWVKVHHADTDWPAFGKITQRLRQGLEQDNPQCIHQAIRDNHRALSALGVVPAKIQSWIAQCEAQGLSAKICGAGSIEGDNGGVLLIYNPQKKDLTPLLKGTDYQRLDCTP